MDLNTRSGPLKMVVQTLDLQLKRLSDFFLIIANVCLGLMLVGTAATIILRLFDVSFYWIWPWTMQFFVWMSFVGFYVVYRRGKDISVDFLVQRLGSTAMRVTQIAVPLLIIILIFDFIFFESYSLINSSFSRMFIIINVCFISRLYLLQKLEILN